MQSTEKNQSAYQHQTQGESARPPSESQQLTFTFHDMKCVIVQYTVLQMYVSNFCCTIFNIFIAKAFE